MTDTNRDRIAAYWNQRRQAARINPNHAEQGQARRVSLPRVGVLDDPGSNPVLDWTCRWAGWVSGT